MSQKNKKKKTKKRGGFLRFLTLLFIAILIIGVLGVAVVYGIVSNIIKDTEPITSYNIENLLAQNSYLYDASGNLLQNVQNDSVRTIIDYDAIDPDIIDAFIAIEDKTFFEHKGFNYIRLIGAVVEAVRTGATPSGTSTITQQYARNMYLPKTKFDTSYVRKIQEAYYTVQIEDHMTKEQIMNAYLNTIDLGANVQGIEAAAKRYFSKSASDVDYIEAAILAGIPKGTDRYSPFKLVYKENVSSDMILLGEHNNEISIVFNEEMIPRFKTVILAMKNNDKIGQSDADYALQYAESKQIVERFHPSKFNNSDITSYFSDMVIDEVIAKFMSALNLSREEAERKLYNGGLHIYSTLDLDMQKMLEQSYNSDTWSDLFDADTRRAVVSFQKKYTLGLDGVVGPNTIAKLQELGLIKAEDMTQGVYRQGMKHPEVILLKNALEQDGLLFKKNDNLPIIEVHRDSNKHLLSLIKDNSDRPVGSKRILNYFDRVVSSESEFVIPSSEYERDAAGNITLFKNRSLNFYNVTNPDGSSGVEAFIKDVYKANEDTIKRIAGATRYYADEVSIKELYIFKGENLKIPFEFKRFDDERNLVISARFKAENPEFYRIDDHNNLLIHPDYYSISNTGIIQPQSAMVIIDYHTGQLKAIVGGRNVTGQKIYNRAVNPRQPGSSIKPLGVYTPALDNGVTAATVYDDVPRYTAGGRRWPKNYFDSRAVKYKGIMTVREALHDSNNVVAVKIAEQIGIPNIIPYLEKFGISTLVKNGNVNDLNLSSVALGGMSKGVTPFDITSAYGAIANGGMRLETITFTRIEDSDGNIVFENKPEQTFVVDSEVAYLMQHIMESGAREGLAKRAAIRRGNQGIPIAGKTGTTSNKNDAWFVGYTPYYVAGMWIGNDIQVSLSNGSASAADYWKILMSKIHENLADKSFMTPSEAGLISVKVDSKSGKLPSSLSYSDPAGNTVINEWFIKGTQPTEEDDVHVSVTICADSGKLINEFCPESSYQQKVYRLRLDPDYDPHAHGVHYAIADDAYTISRKQYEALGSGAVGGSSDAYCHIHTDEPWTAQRTADILSGLSFQPYANDSSQLIITQSIIINTIHNVSYNVDAGSRINASGTVIALDNTDPATPFNIIYPWQIESAVYNPSGPQFNNSMNTSTATTSGSSSPLTPTYDPTASTSSSQMNTTNSSAATSSLNQSTTSQSSTAAPTTQAPTSSQTTAAPSTAMQPISLPNNNGN